MKVTRPLLLAVLCLSACSFAPDYQVPVVDTPANFKETGEWSKAEPGEAPQSGAWWQMFGDAQLNALEDKVTEANQTLKIAVAQYDQARAAAGVAQAAYFPSITATAGATRQQQSHTIANKPGATLYNNFATGADLSYEIDVWGRVRNLVESNKDQAEASADDLATVTLSLHATLASDYMTLRGDDATIDLLNKTTNVYQQALDLTKQRYNGGIASEYDVDLAATQLENAKTSLTDMQLQRAQMEHAIAILTGVPPADFNLAPAPIAAKLPNVKADIPSRLLQRRPDIAAAERRTAAANAEIGVARAAWFPDFNLAAMFGAQSMATASWMTAPSEFWSFGPSAALPLFDGGRISALDDEARAAYDQAVATYRQTVLDAYGEVEDSLAAQHHLEQESHSQDAATQAAGRALAQAQALYKAGASTYLDVVSAENSDLQARLTAVNLKVRRLNVAVQFVQALGGGWQPSAK